MYLIYKENGKSFKVMLKTSHDECKHLIVYSGLSRDDVNVVELHDCFSCNELITYEALGLCPPGKNYEILQHLFV